MSEKGCFASNKHIADFCQCSETKVSTAISKLVELGYLYVESFDGRMRILKSRLSNFERQTLKNCMADSQILKESNTGRRTSTKTSSKDIGEQKRKRFVPPTLEEVRAYCQERKNNVNPEKFIDHYTSNGWMVGRNKMKDWKAAVRTWECNSYSEPKEDKSYDSDRFFEMALRNGTEAEPPKTAADDEGIRERMEKLKERLGN